MRKAGFGALQPKEGAGGDLGHDRFHENVLLEGKGLETCKRKCFCSLVSKCYYW